MWTVESDRPPTSRSQDRVSNLAFVSRIRYVLPAIQRQEVSMTVEVDIVHDDPMRHQD